VSRLYDTLRRMEKDKQKPGSSAVSDKPTELLSTFMRVPPKPAEGPSAKIVVADESRLVALSDPKGLGAEKFRALAARLENIRQKTELKSLQITSAVINEGKSLVAANLALTLAKQFGYTVLLVEGDLHRPTVGSLLGLTDLEGINQWWAKRGADKEITQYVVSLHDVSLSFLSSGSAFDQPSQILQSSRFAEAFAHLAASFDWVVVDSTPMFPTVDANLWSRLVDGTLLVVREGVAPIKALKMGVNSMDSPKWLGVVMNEVSDFNRLSYSYEPYVSNRPLSKK
jgi:capsular exopolysaccharide synthesis family protein